MALEQFNPADDNIFPPILIYGENGAGKTHLACTAPGRKCFIDYAGNVQVTTKFPNEKITCVRGPLDWPRMQLMWDDPLFDEQDVIILDNLTGLYRTLVENVVKDIPLKGGEGYRPSPETPILRDYGLASERLRVFINNMLSKLYRKKGKQIIAICHTKIDKNEETGEVFGGPSLPGQVPAYVVSLFPEYIYLKSSQGKRTAMLQNGGMYPAATRILDGKPVENPNLTEMYKRKA